MKIKLIMKITIKQLQGSECCLEACIKLKVDPTTSILEIKLKIEKVMNISVTCQRLLHLGRNLGDEQVISSYPAIKDGTKLNLTVKKPERLEEVALKHYKKMGLSDAEATKSASRLLPVIKEKMSQMSWDDINRLCEDFLMIKDGERSLHVNPEPTKDPGGL